jgi:hypothetical protein
MRNDRDYMRRYKTKLKEKSEKNGVKVSIMWKGIFP